MDVVVQIGGGDALHGIERAKRLAPVRMVGEGDLPPAAAGETAGIGDLAPQRRHFLAAHALQRIGIEARLGQRQPQQIEGLVAMLVKGAQGPMEIIATDAKAQLDGVLLQPLVIGLAVEIAGALVEHVGGQIGGARLIGFVLAGSAMEGVIQRHQRHRLLAHQPGHDAGRADDTLDLHLRRSGRGQQQRQRRQREQTQ